MAEAPEVRSRGVGTTAAGRREWGTRGYARMRLGEPQVAVAEFERAIAAGAQDDAT